MVEQLLLPKACYGRGESVLDRSYECADHAVRAIRENLLPSVTFKSVEDVDLVVVDWRRAGDPKFKAFVPMRLGAILENRFRGESVDDELRAIRALSSPGAALLLAASYSASIEVLGDLVMEETRKSTESSILDREVLVTEERKSLASAICERWRAFTVVWIDVRNPQLDDLMRARDAFLSASRDDKIDACLRYSDMTKVWQNDERPVDWKDKLRAALSDLNDCQLSFHAESHLDTYWHIREYAGPTV